MHTDGHPTKIPLELALSTLTFALAYLAWPDFARALWTAAIIVAPEHPTLALVPTALIMIWGGAVGLEAVVRATARTPR